MARLGGTLTLGSTLHRSEDELDAELATMSAQLVRTGVVDQADADLADGAAEGAAAQAKGVAEVLREVEAEPPGSEEPPSFTEAALYPDLGEEYERGW